MEIGEEITVLWVRVKRITNLVNLWFGWSLFDLVEFWWSYGGFREKFDRRKGCGD